MSTKHVQANNKLSLLFSNYWSLISQFFFVRSSLLCHLLCLSGSWWLFQFLDLTDLNPNDEEQLNSILFSCEYPGAVELPPEAPPAWVQHPVPYRKYTNHSQANKLMLNKLTTKVSVCFCIVLSTALKPKELNKLNARRPLNFIWIIIHLVQFRVGLKHLNL